METLANLDADILRWVVTTLRLPWLDQPMVWVGKLGVWGIPFFAIALALVLARRDGRLLMGFWRLALAVTLSSVIAVDVLKPTLGRTRPFDTYREIVGIGRLASGASMPSGHAATSVAGAYALSLMWPGGRAVAWALAALIIYSRMYLGFHYPTDVLVGGLVGLACAYFATAATRAAPRPLPHDAAALRPSETAW